ncbi:MAG: GNAT family N-acetyltransferase [Bacillota bacterium]|nr:GNAT family N-acetyltransferase [Bacillota bacterium]
MEIIQASIENLDSVTELFNLYRVFYNQEQDIEGASEFLKERLVNRESVIFIVFEENEPVGFTQLYPLFSSVSMKRSWLLNDLYVKANARKKGYGEALLKKAISFAQETGAKGISLETGEDNKSAQGLYEKIGFKRETNYFYYYSN